MDLVTVFYAKPFSVKAIRYARCWEEGELGMRGRISFYCEHFLTYFTKYTKELYSFQTGDNNLYFAIVFANSQVKIRTCKWKWKFLKSTWNTKTIPFQEDITYFFLQIWFWCLSSNLHLRHSLCIKKEGRVNDSFYVMSMLDGHIVLSYVAFHQAIWKHDYIMLLRYANILHI